MTVSILTPPAAEPVDLAYAKTFLRVDHDHEDALISDMLISARQRVEAMTASAMISQRVVKAFAANSPQCLRLTPGPVLAVHEVRVISLTGETAILPSWAYSVNLRRRPAAVTLSNGNAWHDFVSNLETIEVEMTTGYGASPADVPHPFKQAILMLTAQSYERGAVKVDMPTPMMVDAVLMPFVAVRL